MKYLLVVILLGLGFSVKGYASETKHIYDCPIKSICELLVTHYRTDPSKREIFRTYEDTKVVLTEYEKMRRLRGQASIGGSYRYGSTGNVITLYDGVGFKMTALNQHLILGNII